jgi:hypothetical protein
MPSVAKNFIQKWKLPLHFQGKLSIKIAHNQKEEHRNKSLFFHKKLQVKEYKRKYELKELKGLYLMSGRCDSELQYYR